MMTILMPTRALLTKPSDERPKPRYPLDNYLTRPEPSSPPFFVDHRVAKNDVQTFAYAQRLIKTAQQTMHDLQQDVSFDGDVDLSHGPDSDVLGRNIKDLVGQRIRDADPNFQRLTRKPQPLKDHRWAPAVTKPTSSIASAASTLRLDPTSSSSVSLSSDIQKELLKAKDLVDDAYRAAQDVRVTLARGSLRRPHGMNADRSAPTRQTGGSNSAPTRPTGSGVSGRDESRPAGNVADRSCRCDGQACPRCQPGRGVRDGRDGRVVSWNDKRAPDVRFVPVLGRTNNTAFIEVKTLKNDPPGAEEDCKMRNLLIQELPSMDIPRELTVQPGPYYKVPVIDGKFVPRVDNMVVRDFVYEYPKSEEDKTVCRCEEPRVLESTPFMFDLNHGNCNTNINRQSSCKNKESIPTTNNQHLFIENHDNRFGRNQERSYCETNGDKYARLNDEYIGSRYQDVGGLRDQTSCQGRSPGVSKEPRRHGPVQGHEVPSADRCCLQAIAERMDAIEGRYDQETGRRTEIFRYLNQDMDRRVGELATQGTDATARQCDCKVATTKQSKTSKKDKRLKNAPLKAQTKKKQVKSTTPTKEYRPRKSNVKLPMSSSRQRIISTKHAGSIVNLTPTKKRKKIYISTDLISGIKLTGFGQSVVQMKKAEHFKKSSVNENQPVDVRRKSPEKIPGECECDENEPQSFRTTPRLDPTTHVSRDSMINMEVISSRSPTSKTAKPDDRSVTIHDGPLVSPSTLKQTNTKATISAAVNESQQTNSYKNKKDMGIQCSQTLAIETSSEVNVTTVDRPLPSPRPAITTPSSEFRFNFLSKQTSVQSNVVESPSQNSVKSSSELLENDSDVLLQATGSYVIRRTDQTSRRTWQPIEQNNAPDEGRSCDCVSESVENILMNTFDSHVSSRRATAVESGNALNSNSSVKLLSPEAGRDSNPTMVQPSRSHSRKVSVESLPGSLPSPRTSAIDSATLLKLLSEQTSKLNDIIDKGIQTSRGQSVDTFVLSPPGLRRSAAPSWTSHIQRPSHVTFRSPSEPSESPNAISLDGNNVPSQSSVCSAEPLSSPNVKLKKTTSQQTSLEYVPLEKSPPTQGDALQSISPDPIGSKKGGTDLIESSAHSPEHSGIRNQPLPSRKPSDLPSRNGAENELSCVCPASSHPSSKYQLRIPKLSLIAEEPRRGVPDVKEIEERRERERREEVEERRERGRREEVEERGRREERETLRLCLCQEEDPIVAKEADDECRAVRSVKIHLRAHGVARKPGFGRDDRESSSKSSEDPTSLTATTDSASSLSEGEVLSVGEVRSCHCADCQYDAVPLRSVGEVVGRAATSSSSDERRRSRGEITVITVNSSSEGNSSFSSLGPFQVDLHLDDDWSAWKQ